MHADPFVLERPKSAVPSFPTIVQDFEPREVVQVTQAGFEPAISTVRAWRPQPLVHWAMLVEVAREGVEPTDDHEGLSFAALPVCVPCHVVERPRWDLNPRSPP